ncbi:hypothetical protein [Paenibacillus sp. PAMC21692]|uniref:hypothetical protein n=1 Tax=Paenibacillus sp. PAMC21692 TaxID=2762320 RepID=UPI00164EAAE6|nr:hypothetical protein [Paenibacillus sp. PAMC21692]QNK56986.1 hypothetical protein H7F31_31565 [Paenibacillus sp. PAMC21692]
MIRMSIEERMNKKERSEIAIAIIGSEGRAKALSRCLKLFPSLRPTYYEYRNLSEAPGIAAAADADVLLFTEALSYRLFKARCSYLVPALFVPLTVSALHDGLLRLVRRCGISKISVDGLPVKIVESAIKRLGEPKLMVSVYERSDTPSVSELLDYHRGLCDADGSHGVLTAMGSVAERLNAEGIASEWMEPTEQDMIVTLERALLSTEWRRDREAQVVVGMIRADRLAATEGSGRAESGIQQLDFDILHAVQRLVRQLDGHLTRIADGEYQFVTTRGIFESETGGYKRIPFTGESIRLREAGTSFSIGVGFGYTAGEAGVHARRAIRLAKEGGGDVCYIVREDGSLIGPLAMSEPMQIDLPLVDASLLKRAESAGLTSIYLTRLIGHTTRFGQIDYDARELASVLGVTIRSVHRFLLLWTDAGLVDIVGEEKGVSRGRPRLKYRVSFLNRLIH